LKRGGRYRKIVEWSDEDRCYIGKVPDLLVGGACHGDDPVEVFRHLCEIEGDVISVYEEDGDLLPPRTKK